MIWIALFCTALAAYLIGSFPSGYIAGRMHGLDLRTEGSGNIGATNALRVLGKRTGYLVFAADIFKGWLAVMVAFVLSMVFAQMADGASGFSIPAIAASLFGKIPAPPQTIPFGVLGAICCVVGHVSPVWLGFQGGKGIATSGGVMLALFPIEVFLAGLIAWLVLFYATRYVSIASLAAAIALPTASGVLMIFGRCDWLRVSIAALMCVMAIWRHKENIQRLLAGTEKKFEKKRASPPSPEDPNPHPHV